MMLEKIKELRNKYSSTDSEQLRAEVKMEMEALQKADPEGYEDALIECIKSSTREVRELRVRKQMEVVLPALSLSYVAKRYFHRSKEWFYQRLNENIVNGKPARFTEEERRILNEALKDIARKIGSVSI